MLVSLLKPKTKVSNRFGTEKEPVESQLGRQAGVLTLLLGYLQTKWVVHSSLSFSPFTEKNPIVCSASGNEDESS